MPKSGPSRTAIAQRIDPGRRLEREIDEARPRDLDLGDQIVGAKLRRKGLGKFARLFAGILGEHHGGVGRHVAMGRIARRLDRDARQIDAGRQDAGGDQFIARAANALEHFGKDVMRDHENIRRCGANAERRAPNAIPGSSQKAAHARPAHSGRSCRR